MEHFENWLKREYPDGNIDWRNEYIRLINVLNQAVECGLKDGNVNAGTNILFSSALPTANYLLSTID